MEEIIKLKQAEEKIITIRNHSPDANKMVGIGSGAQKQIKDVPRPGTPPPPPPSKKK
jgi:hypothetical protein